MGKWNKGTIATTCQNLDKLRIPISGTERSSIQGDIPYYGANGQVGYIDDFIFDEPLILIAEDGGNFEQYETRPIAYRINGKSWVNNHAHILRALPAYDQDYIFYSLEHKNVLYYIAGGTRSKLTQKELSKIEIVYPEDIKEQRKIAQILTTLDEAISKTKAIIEKYKAIKEGLMQDLLANGIDENGVIRSPKTHKYKDSPLGKIPVEWDAFSLLDITEKIADRDHTTPVYVKSGVPIISPKDFDEDENISFEKCNYISYEAHLINRKKTDIKPLDIIFTRIGAGLGKSCVVTENMPEFSILHSAALIRANNKVLPYFLMYAMKSFYFQKQIYNGIQSIGVPDLGIDKIAALSVKMPKDKKEQDRIQMILNLIADKIMSEKNTLDKLIKLKMGLMQDLLTHKVSVYSLLERSAENE